VRLSRDGRNQALLDEVYAALKRRCLAPSQVNCDQMFFRHQSRDRVLVGCRRAQLSIATFIASRFGELAGVEAEIWP